jgi:hypothetical protein
MELPDKSSLKKDLIHFLVERAEFQGSVSERQAVVSMAGHSRLIPEILWEGSTRTWSHGLVEVVARHGQSELVDFLAGLEQVLPLGVEDLSHLRWLREAIRQLTPQMYEQIFYERNVPSPPLFSKDIERNQIFISYSHSDKKWLDRLMVHLRPLVRDSKIKVWVDTMIAPGSQWREEIRDAIGSAKVAVLFISADFLASDFIANDELPPLLAAARADGAVILPVIVSPCRFEQTESLSQFQALNPPSRSLVSLNKAQREAVFVNVVKAIESSMHI